MASLETAAAFYDRCADHDWYAVWRNGDRGREGRAAEAILASDAAGDPALGAILASFRAYHTSGPAYGTPRAPMPQRPCGQLRLV